MELEVSSSSYLVLQRLVTGKGYEGCFRVVDNVLFLIGVLVTWMCSVCKNSSSYILMFHLNVNLKHKSRTKTIF